MGILRHNRSANHSLYWSSFRYGNVPALSLHIYVWTYVSGKNHSGLELRLRVYNYTLVELLLGVRLVCLGGQFDYHGILFLVLLKESHYSRNY